ncbi:hypothetical protein [Actinomadura rugatobispora]|uniref:Secreted protein n=1 Tax=Actinomadura rugatobispora TaxID=1994 RepID=A0ABW0ZTH5_9ACTN|nr:hypothetical protein GCM10010200_027660 [Actinomadura rugatobispora]
MADRPSTPRSPLTRRRALGVALGTGAALAGAETFAGSAAGAAPPPGTWTNVPLPDGTTPHMWAVSAPTRRTAFAIGQHSWAPVDVTGVLHWDGRAWRTEPVPPMRWSWYMDLAAAHPRAAWIVGMGLADQVPASLYWNGARWRTAPLPVQGATQGWPGVAAEPGGTAWAYVNGPYAVPDANALLRFERGAWARKPSPIADGDIFLAIAVRSPRDVWLGAVPTSGGIAYTMHWNGRAWQRYDIPGSFSLGKMSLLPISRSSAWGYYAEQLWHWDGTAWSRVGQVPRYGMLPFPYAGSLVSDGQGGVWLGHLAEATSGRAGYLHWDGATWTTFLGPARTYQGQTVQAQVTDMAPIPGTRSMWAVGYEGTGLRPFIERFDRA